MGTDARRVVRPRLHVTASPGLRVIALVIGGHDRNPTRPTIMTRKGAAMICEARSRSCGRA